MIKSTATSFIKPPPKPIPHYPKLMVCEKSDEGCQGTFIVLFTARDEGVIVQADADAAWVIGYHCDNWCERLFKPFNGTITLENDNGKN